MVNHVLNLQGFLAAAIPSVDIALDKLPVDNGKGVLTSRLKYFQRAISLQRVQQKNSGFRGTEYTEIKRIFIFAV